jgi:hypothetical protein
VPSVESLFRHGSNPDLAGNGVSLAVSVKALEAEGADAAESFYRFFFTTAPGDGLKLAQTRFRERSFGENSLDHKIYHPNFSPFTLKPTPEQTEEGIFYGVLSSILLNDGAFLVNYLKSLGVPVRLNREILNREKIDYLTSYKRYLLTINQNRAARKTEVNPLQPPDAAARERVESAMRESMYVDTKTVSLGRDEGQMAWVVSAGPFEATLSFAERQVQRVRYRSTTGEFEILCRDWWAGNGTHRIPRFMQVRTLAGKTYQLELLSLRHYVEREDDIARRLKKWDQVLRGRESADPRPDFLL